MKKFIFYIAIFTLATSCTLAGVLYRSIKWIPKSTPSNKNYLDTIPFEIKYGWIVLQAEIAGKNGSYILDTGAPTILDEKELAREGIKSYPEKDIDTMPEPSYSFFKFVRKSIVNKIDVVKLGNTSFKNVGASTVVFENFSTISRCERFSGIIGANLMNDGVWKISYETNQIIFANDISQFKVNKDFGFKMYPFSKVKNPIIHLTIGDKKYKALVDLGNAGIVIIEPNKDVSHAKLKTENIQMTSPSTLMFSPLAPRDQTPIFTELIELETNICGNNFSFYAIDTLRTSYKDFKAFDIVIGYEFLKHFNITFDWPNEMVYFEPITINTSTKNNKIISNFSIDFFNFDKKVYVSGLFTRFCDTSLISVADTVLAINKIPINQVVGDDFCGFVKGEKSLTPTSEEPVFITVKNKNGRISTVEQKKISLFD
jgi:hypothetical protein